MASITKRGSTWQYMINHYVDGKRKPISKGGFATKREAQIAAAEKELLLKKGNQVIVKEKPFSSYFEEWIELYKSNKHINTYNRYSNSVERVKEYFKDKPIQKITRADYQMFLNEYGKGKSKETVRKLNTHIRACVRDAIEEGYITIDFTRKVELNATNNVKKSEDKHLNYNDSVNLYKELFNRLSPSTSTYHLILLGLVSGLRFGELTGLTTDCFDFKTNQIKVYRAWDYKRGTGFGPLKNEQSERKISIDKKVMNEFKKLILAIPENENNLVFYRQSSVKTVTNEGANKLLRKTLDALEIEHISIHGLRHTHASVLIYKGANIHSVSKRLGHSDIQTTLDHYSHVLKEMEERDEEIAINVYSS
ncbi:tyrosine-type recombinase/integrase [Lysinibacillus sp.]|uniref:site-specific integrase n=1 Tax=Lysinibacillus sp. TaxID=1869345 RepID=UPI00289981F6|nr:tyrosine-type recombinase/integrase [Lysinibacillus sp.]